HRGPGATARWMIVERPCPLVPSRLLLFGCLLAFSLPAHANAAPIALCKKKAGILIREGQCKKRETQVAIDLAGPQGTAGAKGDKGDTGEPGPGALVVRDARGTLVGTVIALRGDK